MEMEEEREGERGEEGGKVGREQEREGEENEQGRQEWKRGRWKTTYLVPNETVITQKIFIPATHLGGRKGGKEKESE